MTVALLAIAGTLATTGGGVLDRGGRIGADPVVSASPDQSPGTRPSPGPGSGAVVAPDLATAIPDAAPEDVSPFRCDDRDVRVVARARWQLRGALAGSRRGFERVTLQLARRGSADRSPRISVAWMSPQEARAAYGIPSFDGRRGLLLSFGPQVTAADAQLIGPVDLRESGIGSITGVYRFVDREGQAHAYIALRDQSCARIRTTGLQGRGRGAAILIDLARP
jgi:hypothetical protein